MHQILIDIKKAYHEMAIKYHPDKNFDNEMAEESFKEAAEAYNALKTLKRRKYYQRTGLAAKNGY